MVRAVAYFWMLLFLTLPVSAQYAEPIFTRTAVPNPAGTVSLKMDFVTPIAQDTGVQAQALPVTRLEIGLGRKFETIFQIPVLRLSQPNGSSVLGVGQFSVALQYLLAGSPDGKFAVAVAGRLEVPSGDSAIVGNNTQLMPAVLTEWRAARRVIVRSNIAWNTVVAGTTPPFANFEQSHSVAWLMSRHFTPVFEFVGSTNTRNGNTQLVVQPEIIFTYTRLLELKAGISSQFYPEPHYDLRMQMAWFFGKRQ
ncbi:MAG TPA: hypothetical protein VN633_24130 [Bryobacteraceae bacterium]|nr:hypothetical protein [Bryobacteraceae bacterium]